MTSRFFRPALAVLAVSLLLSGCTEQINLCPSAAILGDASKRMVLRPGAGATDPAAALYTVEMLGMEADCLTNARLGRTDGSLKLSLRATRAPSGLAARYTVPYFVAVNQGERVLVRRIYNAVVDFAPGVASVTVQVSLDSNIIVLENGRQPVDYQFLAGLEISQTERAYLQTMGRYAP